MRVIEAGQTIRIGFESGDRADQRQVRMIVDARAIGILLSQHAARQVNAALQNEEPPDSYTHWMRQVTRHEREVSALDELILAARAPKAFEAPTLVAAHDGIVTAVQVLRDLHAEQLARASNLPTPTSNLLSTIPRRLIPASPVLYNHGASQPTYEAVEGFAAPLQALAGRVSMCATASV